MAEEVQILQVVNDENYHDGDGDDGDGRVGDNGSDDELICIKRSFDTPAS